MTMSMEQLESRLKRAERRFMLLGMAFVVAVAGMAYLLQGASEKVRTTALEVVDAQGNVINEISETPSK